MSNGVFEVKPTSGDTFLAGEDFDNRLLNYVLQQFEKESGVNLKTDHSAMSIIWTNKWVNRIQCVIYSSV